MLKHINKNKKGFSLVELLVTIIIFGFVCVLTGQLSFQMWRLFNTTQTRWEIQSAVSLACRKFETNRDSLVNAYNADLLYDPVVAEGIIVHPDGTFTWKGKDGKDSPYTLPKEGEVKTVNGGTDPYTYMFSTPAYDESGKSLGVYMYIRHYGQSNSVQFLDAEGMNDVPVEIAFRVGKVAPTLLLDANGNPQIDETTGKAMIDESVPEKYMTHSVEIVFRSGLPEVTVYTLETTFTLVNVDKRDYDINYRGGALVYEYGWLNGGTPAAGPAGWCENIEGYPANTKTVYEGDYGTRPTVTLPEELIEHEGNVMRFISPTAFKSVADTSDLTSGANMASCLTAYAFSDPSNLSTFVLGSLRDFRDNVLRGTIVGDWVIDKYYNSWSPYLIEEAGFLKPLYRAVLVPTSFVCGMIANG